MLSWVSWAGLCPRKHKSAAVKERSYQPRECLAEGGLHAGFRSFKSRNRWKMPNPAFRGTGAGRIRRLMSRPDIDVTYLESAHTVRTDG
jgi:hypothetical protein